MKETARKNIKLIKSFYKSASRGDLDVIRNILDSDVEWNMEWTEPTLPGLWFGGTNRGIEAVLKEVAGPTGEKIEKLRLQMKKFFAVGEHVIAIGSFLGWGKSTQRKLNADTAHVWTLRNGRAVRFEGFHDPANWREVMGLTQPDPQRMAA